MSHAAAERCARGDERFDTEQLEVELRKLGGMAEHLWCLIWCRGRARPYSLEEISESYQRRFRHTVSVEEVAFVAQHLEVLGLVELRAEPVTDDGYVRTYVMPREGFARVNPRKGAVR